MCSSILNEIAPFKTRNSSSLSMPLINENTGVLTQKCSKVELNCLHSIQKWLSQYFLPSDETEILILGQNSVNDQILNSLRPLSLSITQYCRNLGVIFDPNLTLHKHVNSMVQSCFYHLRNISRITNFFC